MEQTGQKPLPVPSVVSGTGSSTLSDSRAAGAQAVDVALSALGGAAPDLVIVHASREHDLREVVAAVRARTGAAEVAGASCDRAFADGVLNPPSGGVMVAVLTRGPYRFGVASTVVDPTAGTFQAAAATARTARDNARSALPYAAAIVYGDRHVHRHQDTLAGIHRVAGSAVPLIGGAAGDSRRLDQTVLLHNDTVIASGILIIWIAAPYPLQVTVSHGWTPVGLPCLVTHSEGTAILEIEGRDPLEVLARYLPDGGADRHIRGDGPDTIDVDRSFALGLIEPDGSQLVRVIYLDRFRTLHSLTPLPQYSAIQVVTSDPEALLDAAQQTARRAVAARPAGLVFAVSCVDRLAVLGDRAAEEPERIRRGSAGAHTFGLFTYGEFARISSVTGYHNATIVALAL